MNFAFFFQNKRLQLNKELDDLRNKLERVAKQVNIQCTHSVCNNVIQENNLNKNKGFKTMHT